MSTPKKNKFDMQAHESLFYGRREEMSTSARMSLAVLDLPRMSDKQRKKPMTAAEMAKRRWAKVSAKKRSEMASERAKTRWANLTPEERSAINRKSAAVRSKKRKAQKKGGEG